MGTNGRRLPLLALALVPLSAYACANRFGAVGGDGPTTSEAGSSGESGDAGGAADAAVPDTSVAKDAGLIPDIACPPVEPPLTGVTMPTSVGGSRLTPVFVTTPDGLDAFVGIRDTLAEVPCALGPDAPTKCTLPKVSAKRFYRDTACTQLALWKNDVPVNTNLVIEEPRYSDAGPPSELTAVRTGGSVGFGPVYQKDATGCVFLTNFEAVEVLSAKTVTEAVVTATRVPLSGRLDAMVWSGADGSSIFAGDVYDRFFEAALALAPQTMRWEPFRAFAGEEHVKRPPSMIGPFCPPNDYFATNDAPAEGTVLVWRDKVVRSSTETTCNCTPAQSFKLPAVYSCASTKGVEYGGSAKECLYLPAPPVTTSGSRLTLTRPTIGGLTVFGSVKLPNEPWLHDTSLESRAGRRRPATASSVVCRRPVTSTRSRTTIRIARTRSSRRTPLPRRRMRGSIGGTRSAVPRCSLPVRRSPMTTCTCVSGAVPRARSRRRRSSGTLPFRSMRACSRRFRSSSADPIDRRALPR